METDNILFSVIIPCYNAQSFVDRVMGSVTGQTMDRTMYEVIAVNDASTDDTLNCLNIWAGRYPDLIRVITYDTNLRQGGARNVAIKQAKGDYICFLDADDWMEEDALESFAQTLGGKPYDIVTAKHVEDYNYPGSKETVSSLEGEPVTVLAEFNKESHGEFISTNLGFVWASVYRKNMIKDNNVFFPEHLAYEDIHWQRLIKFYADSACIIDKVTHHHFNHEQSTMNKKNASHHIDRLTCYEMLLKDYSDRGLLKDHYVQIMNDTMETYLFNSYYMFFTKMDEIPDVYNRIRSTIYGFFPDWEREYDDSDIPMVFQYLLKFMKKAVKASPTDLQPFKDSILEIIEE